MSLQATMTELEAFAKKHIAAEKYPNDYHFFKQFKCDQCGLVAFQLTIQHHSGGKKGNFKGQVFGTCCHCNQQKRLFSFTNEGRTQTREEHPKCTCQKQEFFVGECERIEENDGRMGFFDEGVVVGACSNCEQKWVLVETD